MKLPESNGIQLPVSLKNALRIPRLLRETGRVLMIVDGYFIQREIMRAFEQLGWQMTTVQLRPEEGYVERLLTAILTSQPDMLFTVNHIGFDSGGVVASIIDQVELPTVSWFVDSPAYIILNAPGAVSPLITTPVWERAEIATLTDLGFENVFHLPLATDPVLMGRSAETSRFQVGFVGNSMIEPALRWKEMAPSWADKSTEIALSADRLLRARSNQPDPKRLPNWLSPSERLNLCSAAVLEATRIYRRNSLNALADKKLTVWGDAGWAGYLASGIDVRGGIEYYGELPIVYASTLVNLNFTSFQMPSAINQRVFDAPIAGGFLLTDDQADLNELFASDEVATFSSIPELQEKSDYYLKHPADGTRIKQKAADRILAEHTYKQRISRIIKSVQASYGSKFVSAPAA